VTSGRWIQRLEIGCVTALLVWLVWIPLPFGSVIEAARLPLLAVPLAIGFVAALVRFRGTFDRSSTAQPTRSWIVWGSGALAIIALGLVQLIPLPPGVLAVLSPEAHTIWAAASRVATLAGAEPLRFWPISVDPAATAFETIRVASLFAVFCTAAMMLRTPGRRRALAIVLCGIAMFEALYGMREAALQRFEIWGWVNRLIFDRVTGTFVNPNHFAHYTAIILPLAVYLGAIDWHYAAPSRVKLMRRLAAIIERGPMMIGFSILATVTCLVAILVSQSRGAILAAFTGLLVVAAMLPGRRGPRIALVAAAGGLLLTTLVLFLGPERTVSRFTFGRGEAETMMGRRIGIDASLRIWRRFPLFGSGLGTFGSVVSMEQRQDLTKIYHHVHNDYLELAATGGLLGALLGIGAFAAGYVLLVGQTFGAKAEQLTWNRRAWQAAALASVSIAAVHGLYDFNFFIPSNPATLAAIAGAAVSSLDHDRRTRR
jgi:O-antigen ligase